MEEFKDIILNVGAFAGFAAVVGLAVLSMLYFSQARDVRRLREWAGREPERATEIELRASQIASQAITQAYETMAYRQEEAQAAASVAAQQGSDAVLQDTPVEATGDVYIAVDADGRPLPVMPVENEEPPIEYEEQPAEGDTPSIEEGLIAEDALVRIGASEEDSEELAAAAASAAGPADAPHVTELPVDEAVRPSRLAPSTPAAARGGVLPPLPPLNTSEFAGVARPVPPLPPDLYLSTEGTGTGGFELSSARIEPPRGSRLPFLIAGLLVTIFGALLIYSQFNDGGKTSTAKDRAANRAARDQRAQSTARRDPAVNRPAVTVSVLNGTKTPGLAKIAGEKLIQSGFTETTTGNRNDGEDHVTSTVYYAAGNKIEAQEVGRELDIKAVREIDSNTQAAGGSAPVVVVLGADIEQ